MTDAYRTLVQQFFNKCAKNYFGQHAGMRPEMHLTMPRKGSLPSPTNPASNPILQGLQGQGQQLPKPMPAPQNPATPTSPMPQMTPPPSWKPSSATGSILYPRGRGPATANVPRKPPR